MNESAERWLGFAHEDLASAKSVLRDEIYNQVCFHSQQCAEKALKAVIGDADRIPPRTHSIAELFAAMPADLKTALDENVTSLDDYYIPTRYPDALPGTLADGMPGEGMAKQALEVAEITLRRVEQFLKGRANAILNPPES